MIKITPVGLDEAIANLGALQAKVPSILARTLTETAKDAQVQVTGWLPRLLDRPTPWTMRSLFVFPAEKQDLRAAVAFKHEMGRLPRSAIGQVTAAASMRAQVYGGSRKLKASESTLRANNITPAGRPYLIPAKGAPRDQYGNVPGSFMNRVLYSGVARGSASQGYSRPLNSRTEQDSRTGQFFVRYLQPSVRAGAIGIFKNMGRNQPPMPVFLFSDRASYRTRVPFEQIALAAAERNLNRRFNESVQVVAAKYFR